MDENIISIPSDALFSDFVRKIAPGVTKTIEIGPGGIFLYDTSTGKYNPVSSLTLYPLSSALQIDNEKIMPASSTFSICLSTQAINDLRDQLAGAYEELQKEDQEIDSDSEPRYPHLYRYAITMEDNENVGAYIYSDVPLMQDDSIVLPGDLWLTIFEEEEEVDRKPLKALYNTSKFYVRGVVHVVGQKDTVIERSLSLYHYAEDKNLGVAVFNEDGTIRVEDQVS